MADAALLDRLARHRTLGTAPQSELAWLAEHGAIEKLAVGDVHIAKGESAPALHIVLSGHLVIRADRGAGSHKIFEWRGGDVGGVLPYSRGASPPSDIVAEEPTEVLAVGREWLPDLTRDCPVVTAMLVHTMLDRAREFTSSDLRDEKLLSLGRLAAGLAHELNNPASAAVRAARTLAESLNAAEAAARRLGAARLSDSQLAAIDAVHGQCLTQGAPAAGSALEQADREDAIAAWLAAHGSSQSLAAPLAGTALTIEALDALARAVRDAALDAALQWVSAGCATRALASTLVNSASRISELVTAVKGFTYMDQAPIAGPVDIRRGLADTVTMLAAKTRSKSASVSIQCAPDLPPAHGVGAELNQVWMNLVDNALDAIEKAGHVAVTAGVERDRVVVRIIDDGPGVPAAIQDRIFEPFFTTKGVGEGTGLGLDIVRRLLRRHDGAIDLASRPGRTEFRVSLPISRGPGAGDGGTA
jgi:signal transduction histidine kinase